MKRSLLAAFAAIGILCPALVSAQAPPLLATWTTCGTYGLGRPWHLSFDASGNVYVADPPEGRVFVFSSDGGYVTSWTCPAVPQLEFFPQGIAVSADGHAYVTQDGSAPFRLTAYTTGGDYLGPVGTSGSDPGQLLKPTDVAVDASGNLYITDWANFRIEVLTSTGGYITQWGSSGSGPGQFAGPLAVAVSPAGLVYATDDINQRVEVFTADGTFVREWGNYGSDPGQFAGPWGIALDAAGNVYVADAANNRIQVFSSAGQFLTQWGTYGSGPGQFYKPIGIGIGPDGRIFVADTWNSRIQVFGPLPTPAKPTSWGALKARFR